MQGVDQLPPSAQAEIESWTPAATPDPSSVLLSKVYKTADAAEHIIGFSPSPGGFSGVSTCLCIVPTYVCEGISSNQAP